MHEQSKRNDQRYGHVPSPPKSVRPTLNHSRKNRGPDRRPSVGTRRAAIDALGRGNLNSAPQTHCIRVIRKQINHKN